MISVRRPKRSAPVPATAALELRHVTAGYRRATVLHDVSLVVPKGKIVALLGSNGAGKTTLLRTASGLLRPSIGQVLIAGTEMTNAAPHMRAHHGLCLIPEGRGVFPALSVGDNLRLQRPPWSRDSDVVDRAVSAFPDLRARMTQIAGSMSGGQQQMLALCRAWIAQPDVVLLDEVSMGLAPRVVDQIFEALLQLASGGTALLIVEQYVNRALEIADRVYLLDKGEIAFCGPPSQLDQHSLLGGYFGITDIDDDSQRPPSEQRKLDA